MTDHTERWLPVRGFESFYEVSSLGRVRSTERTVTSRNRWGPIVKRLHSKVLAPVTDSTYGYLTVGLSREGRHKPYKVHRLVCEAFLGPRPDGMDTLHGPGGRQDNSLTNLRYGTRAENELDKIRDGAFNHGGGEKTQGEKNGNSKLTAALVTELRQRYASGERQADLARGFDVTQATISQVVKRQTWKHVP